MPQRFPENPENEHCQKSDKSVSKKTVRQISLSSAFIALSGLAILFSQCRESIKNIVETKQDASHQEKKDLRMYMRELESMEEHMEKHSVYIYLRKMQIILRTAEALGMQQDQTVKEVLGENYIAFLKKRKDQIIPIMFSHLSSKNNNDVVPRIGTDTMGYDPKAVHYEFERNPGKILDLCEEIEEALEPEKNILSSEQKKTILLQAMKTCVDDWQKEEPQKNFSDFSLYTAFCNSVALQIEHSDDFEAAIKKVLDTTDVRIDPASMESLPNDILKALKIRMTNTHKWQR